MITRFSLYLLCFQLLFIPLQAQSGSPQEELRKAKSLVDQHNYYSAAGIYRKLEMQLGGDDRYYYAVCLLAMKEEYERKFNQEEALRQLKKAADLGEMRAWQWLAEIYAEGKYTPVNTTESLKYIRQLCAYDHPKAMYWYGSLLEEGKWMTRDTAKAFFWMLKSAEKKYPEALLLIGNWYFKGICTNKDLVKAENAWKQVADLGNKEGTYNYAYLLFEVKRDTTNGLLQLQRNSGHVPSIFMLARLYEMGMYGIRQNASKAEYYYNWILSDSYTNRSHTELYKAALAYLNKAGAVEPQSESKLLRAAFDRLSSGIRQAGQAGIASVSEMYKKLQAGYQSLEALGFRPGKITRRIKTDAPTDSAWLLTPYHVFETRILHTAREADASAAFVRWNRILQKAYPDYTLEGDASRAAFHIPVPGGDKISIGLEWDGNNGESRDELLLRVMFYKKAMY